MWRGPEVPAYTQWVAWQERNPRLREPGAFVTGSRHAYPLLWDGHYLYVPKLFATQRSLERQSGIKPVGFSAHELFRSAGQLSPHMVSPLKQHCGILKGHCWLLQCLGVLLASHRQEPGLFDILQCERRVSHKENDLMSHTTLNVLLGIHWSEKNYNYWNYLNLDSLSTLQNILFSMAIYT